MAFVVPIRNTPTKWKASPMAERGAETVRNSNNIWKVSGWGWCGGMLKRKMKGELGKTRRVSPSGINILNSFFIKPFIIVLKPINIRTWNRIKVMGKSSIIWQCMGWIKCDDTWQSICFSGQQCSVCMRLEIRSWQYRLRDTCLPHPLPLHLQLPMRSTCRQPIYLVPAEIGKIWAINWAWNH